MLSAYTAFILAGGRSSRMGTDKGLMDFRGKPMIESVGDVLRPLFSNIVIVSNNPAYTKFGFEVIPDDIPAAGPLGGIITGLRFSKTDWSFFVACDMPLVSVPVIETLTNLTEQPSSSVSDVILYQKDSRFEPLCALYHKKSLIKFEECAGRGNFKLQVAISLMNRTSVNWNKISRSEGDPFVNINTPDELGRHEKQ